MSHFRKDSPKYDGGNFDTQKMELLGERLELCTKLRIEFLDRGISSRSKQYMMIKILVYLWKEKKNVWNFLFVGHAKILDIFHLHALKE